MNDTTLIIPAKYEPNSLPLVLDEIKNKRLKLKIIIILDKDDSDTLNAIKNYDWNNISIQKRLWKCNYRWVKNSKQSILVFFMQTGQLIQNS